MNTRFQAGAPLTRSTLQPPRPPWPRLDDTALYGPIGDFVRGVAPHTEADPAALLLNSLVYVGCLLSERSVVLRLGERKHRPCLFAAIVGQSAKARKGTSTHVVREVALMYDPDFDTRTVSGFGSGEALIIALNGQTEGKGVLLEEEELAGMLKASSRDGSTLGQIVRKSWDGTTLQRRVVKGSIIASGYKLSVIAHGTHQELLRLFTEADVFGGTVNRFLWACAKRTSPQPFGGNVPRMHITTLKEQIDNAVDDLDDEIAKEANGSVEMTFAPAAQPLWADLYRRISEDDPPGLLGHALARADTQTLRLAMVYALLDGKTTLEPQHLEAAHAVWRYCRASAAYIFGTATGDHRNDALLAMITAKPSTQNELFEGLGTHNLASGEIERRLSELATLGLIESHQEPTGGRPRTVWSLVGAKLNGTPQKSKRILRRVPSTELLDD